MPANAQAGKARSENILVLRNAAVSESISARIQLTNALGLRSLRVVSLGELPVKSVSRQVRGEMRMGWLWAED
jgi:hypothetical protein